MNDPRTAAILRAIYGTPGDRLRDRGLLARGVAMKDGGTWRGPTRREWVDRIAAGAEALREVWTRGQLEGSNAGRTPPYPATAPGSDPARGRWRRSATVAGAGGLVPARPSPTESGRGSDRTGIG